MCGELNKLTSLTDDPAKGKGIGISIFAPFKSIVVEDQV